ncbi:MULTISPECIES: ABC transporter ATP-binding protein [unclassified Erwinia]|uniref:dipeptide ABC transporter ATP-binding protein n=1 Tax=unclassified Erwinia TaxID=2622719 RepID=UPI0006FB3648|nr:MULTISPECIES: ABC transporter ATP-binding protein [unclassified Erwinia]KQN63575.1 ABC transporter ATP-binding protein [Erwinia sp. Leaf53]PLV55953.1 ABC transporter ATP-binding protein [Erwinia sp. B116]
MSQTLQQINQPALLKVEQLSIDYALADGQTLRAVDGLDLQIAAGEVLAIVGGSGSGKSTTASALVGLLGRSARRVSGAITLGGQPLENASQRQWQRLRGLEIGFVPQDPAQALNPIQTIGTQMREALTLHGVPKNQAALRVESLLAEVGLSDAQRVLHSYPHQLSGGMRQRVLLAMAMSHHPKLIIADEPTSALDVSVQKQVLDALDEMVRGRGIALLLITHDLQVALERADRVLVMQQGKVVESGPAAALFTQPRHPYTRQLLQASPAFFAVPPRRAVKTQQVLLRAEGLVKRFPAQGGRGLFTAVDGVSFPLLRGTTTSLVGESGSGKSTTVRLLLGLETADAGRIEFDGQDVSHPSRAERHAFRRRVQVVYQNPYASLNPKLTLEEIITEPLEAFRIGDRRSRRARAAELMDSVELPQRLLASRPGALSGGQRQRVAIARALAIAPELVVLDEPVSALDAAVQSQILTLLDRLQRELGLSYLLISHDLAVIRQISDYVVVMQRGRVVEQGSAETLFTDPQAAYTRQLLSHVPGGGERRLSDVS